MAPHRDHRSRRSVLFDGAVFIATDRRSSSSTDRTTTASPAQRRISKVRSSPDRSRRAIRTTQFHRRRARSILDDQHLATVQRRCRMDSPRQRRCNSESSSASTPCAPPAAALPTTSFAPPDQRRAPSGQIPASHRRLSSSILRPGTASPESRRGISAGDGRISPRSLPIVNAPPSAPAVGPSEDRRRCSLRLNLPLYAGSPPPRRIAAIASRPTFAACLLSGGGSRSNRSAHPRATFRRAGADAHSRPFRAARRSRGARIRPQRRNRHSPRSQERQHRARHRCRARIKRAAEISLNLVGRSPLQRDTGSASPHRSSQDRDKRVNLLDNRASIVKRVIVSQMRSIGNTLFPPTRNHTDNPAALRRAASARCNRPPKTQATKRSASVPETGSLYAGLEEPENACISAPRAAAHRSRRRALPLRLRQ